MIPIDLIIDPALLGGFIVAAVAIIVSSGTGKKNKNKKKAGAAPGAAQ